ncbi:ankyrin repeat-containing domain, PGG domain protein [Artemisia annua]|uniref:Ankyrin repeat-containing domain, PGG domain protein n=1 Tax=Artemisia annua TaxID=35608 RepID=A0A2U1M657_ARTAN|nr:ankyrin repeat-containing domain, PGG domain protein [Artemisia annua]
MKSGSTPINGVNHTSQHDACSIDMPSSSSRNQPRAQAQLPPQYLLNADRDRKMPIYKAASCGKRDMVDLLYTESRQMTGEPWTDEELGLVYVKCVEADLFDVALRIVTDHPILATKESTVLGLLARKPHGFYFIRPGIIQELLNSLFRVCRLKIRFPDKESESDALKLLRFILEKIGNLPKGERDAIIRGPPDETMEDEKKTHYEKETQEAIHLLRTISENIAKMPAQIFSLFKKPGNETTTGMNNGNQKYSSRVLFLAAETGNTAFVVEVLQKFPDLVEEVNDNGQSIFHVAVSHGHVGIYKLLNDMGSSSRDTLLSIEDKNGNNMLHLVGQRAKGNKVQNVRGVGLRLNPKISWFKEIETIIPPCLREKKNAAGLTPHYVFIKNHKDLFSKGEDWMKEIATQLMVVAALVATTSYTVAFEIPGGYYGYGDGEEPHLIHFYLFWWFLIFDALSFIASTTSILMVLSILGSNYDEYDFMISLSKQLAICLAFVFISIATMIITFLINFFLMYTHASQLTLPILISISAVTPFVIFAFSKYHLWSRITCGFRMLYKTRKCRMN